MRRTLWLLTLALGTAGVLRQRREATAVRAGLLSPLGPDGESGRPVALPVVHDVIAGWSPAPPRGPVGRWATGGWAGATTLVGVGVALLGGRVPRRDADHGCWVAAPVGGPTAATLRAMGATAATIGGVVVSRRDPVGDLLLTHEAAHARQQERLGPLFLPAYATAQAVWGYRDNPFEVAARRAAARKRIDRGGTARRG